MVLLKHQSIFLKCEGIISHFIYIYNESETEIKKKIDFDVVPEGNSSFN